MPIKINLLAEDQALEEERRRDPVKRVYLAAGLLVTVVLVWSSMLQIKVISAKSDLNGLQAQWRSIEKGYELTVNNQRSVIAAEQKLAALQQLVTNRFSWATALNALQHSMNGVDDIQVIHLKCDQNYVLSEEIKMRTNNGVAIPGKPATATEKISLLIDANDYSQQSGANVDRLKKALAAVPYFQEHLQKTNGVMLTSMSAPGVGPNGRPLVTFTLQCFFPEKVR